MRIAFLSWRDVTHPDGGGSEVFVERVGAELVARGHEVTIVCARHPRSAAMEVRDGVRIRRLGGRLTVYLWGLAWLVRHQREVDVVVDVVNGLPFATPLVRRHGLVALVHHLHAEQWRIIYPGWPGRVGWFIESRVVPRLYRRHPFVTVSRASAADLESLGVPPDRITVVRNGLSSAPSAPHVKSDSPRLAVLSRLVPHKQIEHAFEAVARLAGEFPGLHLDVVGDGWWRTELEEAARAAGVVDLVTFHGHVADTVRDAVIGRAWAMVMPSVKEGWCLAITEAGAQGTPSVAYRGAGGVNESIVDGVSGVLVEDLEEMVATLRSLLVDRGRRERLGVGAQDWAGSLTWASCADRMEAVLEETAGQSP